MQKRAEYMQLVMDGIDLDPERPGDPHRTWIRNDLAGASDEELQKGAECAEKSLMLSGLYDEVDPVRFYDDIFYGVTQEELGDGLGNMIIYHRPSIYGQKGKRRLIGGPDLVELVEGHPFAITSGCTYFGTSASKENAHDCCALIFDLDDVSLQGLQNLLGMMREQPIKKQSKKLRETVIPTPTYLVNSGTGFHLYYVLEEPMPMYRINQEEMGRLKKALTKVIWTPMVTKAPMQYQGIFQKFRMPGTETKFAHQRVKAWKVGPRWTAEDLATFTDDNDYAFHYKDNGNVSWPVERKYTLEEAVQRWPDWAERKQPVDAPRKYWTTKRDLYDWWLRKLHERDQWGFRLVMYGHRYFCVMALAIYAVKAGIGYEELEADALGLIPDFNSLHPDDPFTEDDVREALTCYEDAYFTFPREEIETLTMIEIPPNKRNYQNQRDHLEDARAVRDRRMKRQGRTWRNENGRPKGSGTKEEAVLAARAAHPEASISELSRLTGISRPTLYKYLQTP